MDKLIDACSEYFKDQVGGETDVEEVLQRLRVIHPQIQAVISSYSQAEIKDPALNKWYWQLRDAIDEADDVLDEFEYWKLERQVIGENKGKRKAEVPVWKLFENFTRALRIGKPAPKSDPNLKRLEEAVQKLSEISTQVSNFLHLLDRANLKQEQQQVELHETRETGSMIKNVLIGRSKEMEFITQWLRDPNEAQSSDTDDLYKNISVLCVVGHGGMGKTSLLQHAYKDVNLNKDGATEGFDVKMWACVSQNFDSRTVKKNILESLLNERPNLGTIEALQSRLQSQVTSKRFLLVLDDIWEEDGAKWENVLAPLKYGSSGSKILITTRMKSVALKIPMIENKKILPLMGLEEEECSLLFKIHAFGKNSNIHENFLSMAGDIVKKLSRSPLAAKLIGSSLRSKDLSYWRKVKVDIEKVGLKDLLPILKLSYTYLSDDLQNCFAFCSIFPEDHEFDKDDLVRMWIALGFIQPSNIQGETLEETGIRYFHILVEKSFFDKFQSKYNDDVCYQMHDLLHELAQLVSKQECFRATDVKELTIPPKTIRHLSLDIDNSLEAAFKKMGDLKNLRSLFISSYTNCDALCKIFEASKSIRLLYVDAPNLIEISEMINCLTHLRYFYLSCQARLPRSISQLYHLQIMIYEDCGFCPNDFLPKDINNLYNLRYLRLPSNENCMIYEIGKLKSLQELNHFYVKNEIGYGIEELEHMKEIRQISIRQLENINDVEEARSAKFNDKKNLTDLNLQWGDFYGNRENIVDHDLDEKILDRIQPYNNLKKLCINAYMGVRSAIWMKDVSVISNLEYIKLKGCLKWKILPPFGQLPFLKFLYLHEMPEVEQLEHNKDCTFPSLEVLDIFNLNALQEWFDTTLAAAENGCLLPCLIELHLHSCPKLQELPSLPSKLQKLYMNNIGWKGCNWLQGIRNCSDIHIANLCNLISLNGRQELKTNENCQLIIDYLGINDPSLLLMEPLRSISSLRFLEIKKNVELVSFPTETEPWFQQHSSSLIKLEFEKLQSLQCLPPSLESFSSLKFLRVDDVPQLKLLPNLPASLVKLELSDLEALQCLPSSLSAISSLENLKLINIPLLKSLPDLPSSLKKLELKKFESLQCLPSSLSAISSLKTLKLINIPLLKSLSDLPSSVKYLDLYDLKSLQCLPSSLSVISSLETLKLINIPLLKSLPNLPSSVKGLELEALQCLPSSLSTFSSVTNLRLKNFPLLKSLPDLPSSLTYLSLEEFENLDCLTSCIPTTTGLKELSINKVPRLLELPDHLLHSLHCLRIYNCDPQLMERYEGLFICNREHRIMSRPHTVRLTNLWE